MIKAPNSYEITLKPLEWSIKPIEYIGNSILNYPIFPDGIYNRFLSILSDNCYPNLGIMVDFFMVSIS